MGSLPEIYTLNEIPCFGSSVKSLLTLV